MFRFSLIVLFFMGISYSLLSQKTFEGVVILESSSNQNIKVVIEIIYGKNKIKEESTTIYTAPQGDIKEKYTVIYDYEKGVSYFLFHTSKSYDIDSLRLSNDSDIDFNFQLTDSTREILGYPCRLYVSNIKVEEATSPIPPGKLFIWFSTDLRFIVPEPYRKRLLPIAPDGNMLWLESKVVYNPIITNTKLRDTIRTRAVSIKEMKIEDSVFFIPKGYTLYSELKGTALQSLKTEKIKEVDNNSGPPSPSPSPSKSLKSPLKKTGKQKDVNN